MRQSARPGWCRLLLVLILAAGLRAAPVQVPVSALASDVVYLGAGASEGLSVGLKGELRALDGRRAELEVLFVSSGKASCRVSPAGADVRVGDPVWFELTPAVVPDSLTVRAPAAGELPSAELPPAAVAALERSAALHGPWIKGWWRLDGTRTQLDAESSTRGRQALGLRMGLAQQKDLVLSLQLRNRSEWSPQADQEGWVDQFSLAGTVLRGGVAWEAGRMADGRGALPGPVDGLALESAGRRDLSWGLSAGSRPAAVDQVGERAGGAGGRLRWQPRQGPLSSDLKARWEQSGAGVATAGASWSNQLRFLQKGRLEHWLRAEFSEQNQWDRAVSQFSSTRLRWQEAAWQVEGRHQLNTMPVVIPEDLLAGPRVEDRQSQLLELAVSRQWGATWLQLRTQGRGERLDGDLERLLEVNGSLAPRAGLLKRVGASLLAYLGPLSTGQDLELRLSGAPASWPELELALRGWRLDQSERQVTGWNGSLYARGRLWRTLRWEGGGLLQREEGLWLRELRVGLRGDLNLKFSRMDG